MKGSRTSRENMTWRDLRRGGGIVSLKPPGPAEGPSGPCRLRSEATGQVASRGGGVLLRSYRRGEGPLRRGRVRPGTGRPAIIRVERRSGYEEKPWSSVVPDPGGDDRARPDRGTRGPP